MGFLTPDHFDYDPGIRQSGFNRYRQCLSFYAGNWLKINLLTVAGAFPLAAGIAFSILSSSILVLIPCAFAGGMLFGPFLAGMYDAVLRGLRDDPSGWREAYRKSWRQNGRESLIPGGILGLLAGVYCFMAALLWWSRTTPAWGTLALYIFSGFLLLLISTLYWPQLVLFRQTSLIRLRNCLLFAVKYFWRTAGVAAMKMLWILILILFAPWSLILIPFLGFWYILFVTQFFIYSRLDSELEIENRIHAGENIGEQ